MTDADVHYNSTTTLCTAAQPCVSSRISSFDPNVITQHSEARCGFGGSRATCMCGSRFTVSESQDTGSEGGVWGVGGCAQDGARRKRAHSRLSPQPQPRIVSRRRRGPRRDGADVNLRRIQAAGELEDGQGTVW